MQIANEEDEGDASVGVMVFIYSPLGSTAALGSNRLKLCLRLIHKVGGGRIREVGCYWPP